MVISTADPDLAALTVLRERLGGSIRSILADSAVIEVLSDKRRFGELAARLDIPVPRTYTARSMADVQVVIASAEFPLIIKPPLPNAWHKKELPNYISKAKAILTHKAEELLNVCSALEPFGLEILIQEYIPGEDEEHYDVHAYIDPKGQALATFTGRKWRIYPVHAGNGCFVESKIEPELEALTVDILSKTGYTGIANVNFKRHSITGAFKLLEINPRVSMWNILAARAGINLPWIAYQDACGLPQKPKPPRRAGIFYVNGKMDFHAFQDYHRLGELSWFGYLGSLLRFGMVYQALSLRDPGPAIRLMRGWFAMKLGVPPKH